MNPPQPVPRIEQLDTEIRGEQAKWAEMGINPTPEFVLNCRLRAFTSALNQLGISEEDLNLILNEIVLVEMQKVREEIQAQQVGLVIPDKRLLGADGSPII